MRGLLLLQRWLSTSCEFIHAKRLEALLAAVGGLLEGQRLTLTDLGRYLPDRGVMPRHGIKRMDRLLGNKHLQGERGQIYQALGKKLLSSVARPVLLVDWSDLQSGRETLVLKAAVVFQGRAITVYEEVHRLTHYNAPRTHKRFLTRLSQVIPAHCHPIVVSDAGFRGPWFQAVEALGWDWVGRVRNRIYYSLDGEQWNLATSLYAGAKPRVRSVGRGWLSKQHRYACGLYLIHQYRRGPGRPKRRRGGKTAAAKNARQMYKEPWLLATSLKPGWGVAQQVVKLYAKRMQIELTFRDDKGTRWGWKLSYSGSRTLARLNILMLIGTLATLISILVGLAAESRSWLKHVQAASTTKRRTLSTVFLGRYLLLRPPSWLTLSAIQDQARTLSENIANKTDFVGIP